MRCLLGIDLGSTSLKAVAFNKEGHIVAKGTSPTVVEHLDKEHPEWAFWHPDRFWEGVVSAVKQVTAKLDDPGDIKGVAVTGFGMDGLPLDKEGDWLYPFISWHCSRTLPQSKEFGELVSGKQIFQKTGKQVAQIDSLYRLMWMKENKPDILAKTDKWLLVEDFINNKLCGSKTIDYSMGWCTSMMDIQKKEWLKDILECAGLDEAILPEILPSGTRIGEVHKTASLATGLKMGTPVLLGGHDYICAALAMGAFTRECLMDVTGTWEMVVNGSDRANLSNEVYQQGLNVESHVAKDRFCVFGSAVSSDMIEWFRRNFGFGEAAVSCGNVGREWKLLIETAQSAPCGSNGVIFLPHFSGAGAPVYDDESKGAFVGLTNIADRACMLRAMFEGLTFQMKEMVEAVENAVNSFFETVVVTGGATKNEFWMQMKADIINKTIVICDGEESSALGAAMIAGIGLGIYKDEQDAFEHTFRIKKRFYPRPEVTAQYEKIYVVYKKIYNSLKEVNSDIGKL